MSALCQHGPSNSCPSVLVHLLFLPAICQFLIKRPPITETPDFPQMVQAKHHTFFLTGSLPSHAIACTSHDTNTYTCFYNMAFRPRGVILLGATPSPTRRASPCLEQRRRGKSLQIMSCGCYEQFVHALLQRMDAGTPQPQGIQASRLCGIGTDDPGDRNANGSGERCLLGLGQLAGTKLYCTSIPLMRSLHFLYCNGVH